MREIFPGPQRGARAATMACMGARQARSYSSLWTRNQERSLWAAS